MTPSDWDVVREAIAKVEPPSDIIACGCIGLNDEQGRCRCEQDYPAGWALHRLQAENERLRMWIATDVARARGLAESMTELGTTVRLEGIEENCAEIVALLAPAIQPEAPPQAGDLLVIPYRPGDVIPAGWTVEGDKMWRRADGTEAGRALGGGE